MLESQPVIDAQKLSKRFDPKGEWILDGVSMTLSAGERLAIVGPSGSGKSTLLSLIGALAVPDSGSVTILGSDVGALDDSGRALLRRQHIGFVFQDHHLLPQCSALQNILLPLLAGGLTKRVSPQDTERATALLERLGLGDRQHSWPHQLSTGQRQRVSVARALINGPSIVLADEPTGSLDRQNTDALMNVLLENTGETSLVLVTHSERLAAMCDRVLQLEAGLLRERGASE